MPGGAYSPVDRLRDALVIYEELWPSRGAAKTASDAATEAVLEAARAVVADHEKNREMLRRMMEQRSSLPEQFGVGGGGA